MAQTMLAVLALMMTATYAFNVTQRHVGMQHMIIAREVEEMAASTALEVMEIVRARKFDQAVDAIPAGHMLDVSNLTFKGSEEHFDTGKACAPFVSTGATCNYIEDFHKVQMDRREFKMGDHTVYFDVEIRVEYVNNAMERSNQREIHKRITVSIQDYWPGGKQFLNQPIELSRVISYTS